MPLYAFVCLEGHQEEHFMHHRADLGAATFVCSCGHSLAPMLSLGVGLTWFEEGRGRWIHNLGDQPVYITSHEQHKRAMRAAGVDWATGWATRKTGGWV